MKIKLRIVTWGDAWGLNSWADHEDDDHKPMQVVSAGILIREDETGIALSRGNDEVGRHAGVFFIPRGMIQKVKRITLDV